MEKYEEQDLDDRGNGCNKILLKLVQRAPVQEFTSPQM
jgi:hypothetical protein